jgi:cobalt/nickel transport system ATP-binding protein
MKRRAALATVLAMHPDILVMDEPTAGLDDEGWHRFVEIVRSFPHTTLIVTHDKQLMHQICQRIVTLEDGVVAQDEQL